MADFKFVAGAIIALVVILIVMSAYGKLPALAQGGGETIDKTAEALGVPLNLVSSPKILSVTPSVGPDGTLAVAWTLNKDAQDIYGKSGADFRAEFLYKENPGDEPKSVCTAYLIGSETTGTQDGFTCYFGDKIQKTAFVNKKASELAPAGGYEIRLSFKREGQTKFEGEKDTVTGFYDENYVEMLHKEVSGCKDDNYWNCNVIECKKELINKNLLDPGSASPLELRRTSGVLKDISEKFRSEKGFSSSNDCGKVGDAFGNPVPPNRNKFGDSYLVVKGCSDKDVDGLNIKVARARLLESAYSMDLVDSEDKYSAHSGRLKVWKDEAARITMSCTEPLGWANSPAGAYSALKTLNWQFVPSGSTPAVWKGRVNAELGRFN